MRAIRLSLMASAAALALSACRARLPAVRASSVEGSLSGPGVIPTRSDPKPPKPDTDSPPPPPGGAAGRPPKRDALASKKPGGAPAEPDDEEQPAPDDPAWKAAASTQTASLSGGGKPDDGGQQGTPLARRPDEGAVASPGPPLRYLSPALLRARKTPRTSPDASDDDADALDFDPAASGGKAKRPARAPATGLGLDDSIPETGIADPDEIGSYHVQIASSPEFAKVLFDKTYPFMGEAELQRDLNAAPSVLETVWIRWSMVDLLDYEHPFTKPHRLKLAKLRAD